MSPDDGLLEDMLREARLAVEFVAGMTASDFLRDAKTQHAVVRCLEIIGEAASRVSKVRQAKLETIPWPEIIAQRHIAIHHYRKLEMPRIWTTVQAHVPGLIAVLEHELESRP